MKVFTVLWMIMVMCITALGIFLYDSRVPILIAIVCLPFGMKMWSL